MQKELERSVLTSQMLENSATLRSTSSQHDTLSSVMHTSKQLVTALEKSDWLDRVLILSGFFFFIMVVLFILKQRIVDRGIRLAFWWTRFIPSFSDDAALLRTAEKGMASAVVSATSSLSVIAVSLASSILPTATSLSSSSSIVLNSAPLMDISVTTSVVAQSATTNSFTGPAQETVEIVNVPKRTDDASGVEPNHQPPDHIEL
jgi:protein transport protein SEC20